MAPEPQASRRGLILVHIGTGKGKTTAALGLALRALGHGMRVQMIQFVKAYQRTGEHFMAESLGPGFQLRTLGCGFIIGEWTDEDIAAAREAWEVARQALTNGTCDLLILDEILYPVMAGVISTEELIAALTSRTPGQHVVLTGREAPPEVLQVADLVTDMQCLKHPYDVGVPAQEGIEF